MRPDLLALLAFVQAPLVPPIIVVGGPAAPVIIGGIVVGTVLVLGLRGLTNLFKEKGDTRAIEAVVRQLQEVGDAVNYIVDHALKPARTAWSEMAKTLRLQAEWTATAIGNTLQAVDGIVRVRLPRLRTEVLRHAQAVETRLLTELETLRTWVTFRLDRLSDAATETATVTIPRLETRMVEALAGLQGWVRTQVMPHLQRQIDTTAGEALARDRTLQRLLDSEVRERVRVDTGLEENLGRLTTSTLPQLEAQLQAETGARTAGDVALAGQLAPVIVAQQTMTLPAAQKVNQCAPALDRMCQVDPRHLDDLFGHDFDAFGLVILAMAAPALAELGNMTVRALREFAGEAV